MKFSVKKLLFAGSLLLGLLLSPDMYAQTACCSSSKQAQVACKKEGEKAACAPSAKTTSGCTPSACRGAKTKFGEAKVISNLRLNLIALKADMEKSTDPEFEPRAYDIHGIVGESDDQSLQIISDEVQLIEEAFAQKMSFQPLASFDLPESKARQVRYLNDRIKELQKLL